MPNATLRADAQAMPNRRAALGALAAAAGALLAAPRIARAADLDADLLALSAEILRRCAEAAKFDAEHIEPDEPRFGEILDDKSQAFGSRFVAAWAFSDEVGRTAAIDPLATLNKP